MTHNLRASVLAANFRIVKEGLVLLTWGNVSAVDRERGVLIIKPSGVSYDDMTEDAMVAVSLTTGAVVEGHLRPSSDTPTHLELYRSFPGIGAVVHTHSLYATAWAQSGREIPVLGTTHADHFRGPIPVTRSLRRSEIDDAYEKHTGMVIVERFRRLNATQTPAVLVKGHAPFCWGVDLDAAVRNAVVLERVAHMACETLSIHSSVKPLPRTLLDKHYLRKHGSGAYYGQSKR